MLGQDFLVDFQRKYLTEYKSACQIDSSEPPEGCCKGNNSLETMVLVGQKNESELTRQFGNHGSL
jgi:hypothetical protein